MLLIAYSGLLRIVRECNRAQIVNLVMSVSLYNLLVVFHNFSAKKFFADPAIYLTLSTLSTVTPLHAALLICVSLPAYMLSLQKFFPLLLHPFLPLSS